ncbi:MAG TPA: glycosyltransferase family 9 protein [Polyangiales bacterium]|nr:glycosyltransferase family 9 protein [Polyangiales bacterium]
MDRDVFIFRIGHLGDTLVSLPAVHRIAQMHRGARLWLITNAPSGSIVGAWDVLRHTGLFQGALFYRRKWPWHLLQLAVRCRLGKDARLYYLSPARTRTQMTRDWFFFRAICGFGSIEAAERGIPHAVRDPEGQLLVLPRECDRLLRSVDPTGAPPPTPYLSPPPAAQERARRELAHLSDRPLIALGPGSKMPAKKWFIDRYVEICRRITAAHPNLGIVLFGGPEDRNDAEILANAVGRERAANLAGVTDVIESAAAMLHCGLYLGNDTGTMHLAAIMGLPCIAVFTSRDNRETWSPWGDDHVILRRDLPCSGCMLERCEHERMRCLDLITVDDVWQVLAPRLAALARGPRSLRVLG